MNAQHLIGHDLLQSPVLRFELFEPLSLLHFQQPELLLPSVKGLFRDVMLITYLQDGHLPICFAQDTDLLFDASSLAPPWVEVLRLTHYVSQFSWSLPHCQLLKCRRNQKNSPGKHHRELRGWHTAKKIR